MAEAPTYPGVYVEEMPGGIETIASASAPITAFLGQAPRGPVNKPTLIDSFPEYERRFGGLDDDYPMSQAVSDFFASGGEQALIIRLSKETGPRVKEMHGRGELRAFLTSNGLKKLN